MRARALREDLEDEEGAIVDGDVEGALEIALLRRTERLVEDDLAGAMHLGELADLVGLAAAHEERRVGCLAPTDDAIDRDQSRCLGQQAELFKFVVEMRQSEIDADEDDGAILASYDFRQAGSGIAGK